MRDWNIHMKTGQNDSVAWQGPAQGVEAQVVSGIALMQLAIGWTPLSIMLLSKEDRISFLGIKYSNIPPFNFFLIPSKLYLVLYDLKQYSS